MPKKTIILAITLPFLVTIFVFSYSIFTKYRPKILKQIEEVRGIKTERSMMIPFPRGSEKISYNKTLDNEQLIYKTNINPEEIQVFYQNLLSEKEWILDSTGIEKEFHISKYKKEDAYANITAMHDEINDNTIVSVEIAKR